MPAGKNALSRSCNQRPLFTSGLYKVFPILSDPFPVRDGAEVWVHVAVYALVAGPLEVAARVAPVELAVAVPVAPVALLTGLLNQNVVNVISFNLCETKKLFRRK